MRRRIHRKGLDKRPLTVKIRVTAEKGIINSQEDLMAIIHRVVQTHVVPKGVTIHWIDWKKGEGGKANEGRISRDIADALESFWFAIAHEDSTVEIAKMEAARRESRSKVRGAHGRTPRRRRPRR